MNGADALPLWRAPVLGGIAHGFAGRRGGVSDGAASSLNAGLGSGDDPGAVRENRRRAGAAVLAEAPIVGVYQTHSARCVTVEAPWDDEARPEADALVTARRGVLLAIVTADCAPVLLADPEAGVVGAAHAGWRGALGGVTDAALAAMLAQGARIERIVAAVGPCIARASYEVDDGFAERFLADDADNARFFGTGPAGRPHFDLEAYVVARLAAAGVRRIAALGLDTYAREADFFSFRRSTHRAEATYGRQVSLIGLG